MDSLQDAPVRVEASCGLSRFRTRLYACFTRRGDALFELADAMLCAQGPVRSPVELSLEPEFRRRHGSVYEALAKGRISSSGLRRLLVGLSAPARAGEPLMFGIDTTPHARPDAQYADEPDERTMVQVRGKGGDRWLPGWPYSLLVGIQWGSSSWAGPIEARRVRPGEEHTDVTIGQITGLLQDLAATRTWPPGDPPPLVLLDVGNYATDLTHALAGQDVQLLVRLRSTRVFYLDPAPRRPGQMGPPPRHGAEFSCSDPARRHAPDFERTTQSALYGTVTVRAWTRLHQNSAAPAAGPAGHRASRCRSCAARSCTSSSATCPTAASHPRTCGCGTPAPSQPTPTCSEGLPAPIRPRALSPLGQVLSRPGQRTPELDAQPRASPSVPARCGSASADSAHKSAHPPARPNPPAPAPAARKARRTARNPSDRPTARANRSPANTKSDDRSLNRKLRRAGEWHITGWAWSSVGAASRGVGLLAAPDHQLP
jgi:DDE superfamily endonuclease